MSKASKDACHKDYPNVATYAGGSGKPFDAYMKQTRQHAIDLGGRSLSILMSEEEVLVNTVAAINDWGDETIRIEFLKNARTGASLRAMGRAFKTFEMLGDYHNKERKAVWNMYYATTDKAALAIVIAYGVERVQEIRPELKRLWGTTEEIEIKMLEQRLESGSIHEDGRKLRPSESPVTWLNALKELAEELKAKAPLSTKTSDENLAAIIERSLPGCYNSAIEQAKQRKANVRIAVEQNVATLDAFLETMDTTATVEVLTLAQLEACVIHKWRVMQSEKGEGRAEEIPAMIATSKKRSASEIECWNCGNSGHVGQDCTKPQSQDHCPARLKGTYVKDWTPGQQRKKVKFANDGGGGGGGKSSSKGGGKGNRGAYVQAVCYNYRDNGFCKHGDRCHFSHENAGTEKPVNMQSLVAKTANAVNKLFEKNMSKAVKTASKTKGGKSSKSKKDGSKSNVDSSLIYNMIASSLGQKSKKKRKDSSSDESSDDSDGQYLCLSNYLHDITTVGMDSCSGRSCSTERSDFMTLDTSEVIRGVNMTGIGGKSEVAGIGVMVVTVNAPELGRTVLLVDPDAVYIKPLGEDSPRFRVFCTNRLKKMGVTMSDSSDIKQPTRIICVRTKRGIDLKVQGDISVLETRKKDARNYSRNIDLKMKIKDMRNFTQSPLFVEESMKTIVQMEPVTSTVLVNYHDELVEMRQYREHEQEEWSAYSDSRHEPAEPSFWSGIAKNVDVKKLIRKVREQDSAMVITMNRLTQEQRARLWHWRFGHMSSDMPVRLTRNGRALNLDVNHRLCEDCPICDKARFRISPFPRSIMVRNKQYPPYHIVYADGCGGQRSMGVPSFGGAVGNFIFVDLHSGDYQSLLYSKRSQFPDLLERYLIGVLALQYEVRILRVDGDSVNIGQRVEALASLYGFVIQPMSAGTPQENGFAEKAVGDATRLARAFMLGAPHLLRNLWGLAYRYAGFVNMYVEKVGRGGLTPYESIHHRTPDMKRSGLHIFGCPSQMVPLDDADDKMSALTKDSNFVGLDPPSYLMQRHVDRKIMRVSPKKVRCHEGMYCKNPMLGLESLEYLISLVDSDDEEDVIPSAVPSIKVLRPGKLYDPLSNQGKRKESLRDNPLKSVSEFRETHAEIGQESDAHVVKLRQELLSVQEDTQESIRKALDHERKRKADHTSDQGDSKRSRVTRASERYKRDREPVECEVVRSRERTSKRQKVMSGQVDDQPTTQTHTNLDSEPALDHALVKLKVLRPPISRVPIGSRVMIESVRFDGVDTPGRYSNTAPKYTHGTVMSKGKSGLVKVLWDGDKTQVASHNKHLLYSNETSQCIEEIQAVRGGEPGEVYMSMCASLSLPEWQEPFKTLAMVERASVPVMKPTSKHNEPKRTANPISTWEALVSDQWRDWITAIRKEHDGWIAADVYEIVNKSEMKPGEICIDVKEIFSVKRDGTPKYRSALRGDQLRKDVDYHATFSGTISADGIRMFFSLACQLGKVVRSGDVRQAYLQGKQRIPIFAFLPSYIDIIDLSWEELMTIRKDLLKLVANEGTSALKNLNRKKRRESSKVLKLLGSVYGAPDAGNEWGLLLIHILTVKMGMQRSSVDGCLYWLTRGEYVTPVGGGDSVWTHEYLICLTWTDDIPYFGTPELEVWFKTEVSKHLPMVWKDVCDEFVSIEVKQDLVRGTTELKQEKYWAGPQVRFGQYLNPPFNVRIPIPEGTVMVAATPEEFELAKHLPYPELVGTIAFPSCHTKLEIRLAVAMLCRYMQCWNLLHWAYAIHLLKYCINSKAIGMMYSRGLDRHGVNVLYAYADSAFTAPRSQGCRLTMMNGAVISLSSQKHSTIDTSTTAAELTELFLASNDVVGFRNLLREIGFKLQGPTVMYEDNQPAIAVAEGERNLSSKTKHMDIRTWKLKERIDDQEIILHFCGTVDMLADIGTKALGVKPFEYLRDLMNGYALVRLKHKGMDLPVLVICLKDLEEANPVFRQ